MSLILAPMPPKQTHKVLIGTSVRKSPPVLKAYLETLAWQEWPPGVEPHFCFVVDTNDEAVLGVLRDFAVSHPCELVSPSDIGGADFDDTHPATHQWAPSAMARVGRNKDYLLRRCVEVGYSAIWLVDADLLLDKTTFASLWSQRCAIASAVYWTHWHNPATLNGQLHAAPQVWLVHPYQLHGRGYDEPEFRRRLIERERIQVWGQGACTLIRREAIEKGVRFEYVPGMSTEGMMAGEDRHFCIRATSLHLPMIADPWPDIFHIYHPQDQQYIPDMLERLGASHSDIPRMGDWVNLILEPLEPVPSGPQQIAHLGPIWFRGRLGGSKMLPELEERIGQMKRGSTTVLGCHFPAHHPVGFLRGQRRLIKVTLVDSKPWGFAPVIERELLQGMTGAFADRTTLTVQQQRAIREDQKAFEEVTA